jgi:hypothetical protein
MKDHYSNVKSIFRLAIVNSALWALAIVALVFVIQDYPGVKGFFTILAGGSTIATILLLALIKLQKALH